MEMEIIIFYETAIHSYYDQSGVRKGYDKIKAIKAVRRMAGSTLREAKDCVEATYKIHSKISPAVYDDIDFKDNLNIVRASGGTVIFDEGEWEDYIDEIKEMLFRAKMSGHNLVVYKFESIIKHHAEYEKLNKLNIK